VVLTAVTQKSSVLPWASEALMADKELMLAATKRSGEAPHDAAEALMLTAQNAEALRDASAAFRADRAMATEQLSLAALLIDLLAALH